MSATKLAGPACDELIEQNNQCSLPATASPESPRNNNPTNLRKDGRSEDNDGAAPLLDGERVGQKANRQKSYVIFGVLSLVIVLVYLPLENYECTLTKLAYSSYSSMGFS
jgi:hypothetical protein